MRGSRNNFTNDEFDKDFSEALVKLNQAVQNSKIITRTIEEKLNKGELESFMVLMRDLMPVTI